MGGTDRAQADSKIAKGAVQPVTRLPDRRKGISCMWPLHVVWVSSQPGRLRAVIGLNQGLRMLGMRVLAYTVEIKAPLKKNDV